MSCTLSRWGRVKIDCSNHFISYTGLTLILELGVFCLSHCGNERYKEDSHGILLT